MVREATKFLRNHADAETVALYRTFVIDEVGNVNEKSALRALVKLNYGALADQATKDIAEAEKEATKATKKV